jgi:hypothetical protein
MAVLPFLRALPLKATAFIFLSSCVYLHFTFFLITRGTINTRQAIRKMMLPARLNMLLFSMLEAIKKPAHTRKRIQPHR